MIKVTNINYFCAADYLRLPNFSLTNWYIFRKNTQISLNLCCVDYVQGVMNCDQAPTSTRGYSTTRFSNHYSYPTRKILLLDRVVE